MIDQVVWYGLIDIEIVVNGDLYIDVYYMVEDMGIILGMVLVQVWGDKKGVWRYGYVYVLLDEVLLWVVLDLLGCFGLIMDVEYICVMIGGFDVDLFGEFFQGLVNYVKMILYIDNFKGKNVYYQVEIIFKVFG